MQRDSCKNCFKRLVATTGTLLARQRKKERWINSLNCMIDSGFLRESAILCGINLKTSFLWRPCFLQLPSLINADKLEGIIEADETFFPYSEKGKKNLDKPAKKRGRSGASQDVHLKTGLQY